MTTRIVAGGQWPLSLWALTLTALDLRAEPPKQKHSDLLILANFIIFKRII
jgi:hypothetical protein